MTTSEVQRGEIWWLEWSPGRGSEQSGRRPAVVVQTDAANRNPRYPNTIVVAISRKGKPVPSHVALHPDRENGLVSPSFAKCEQVLTVAKARLEQRLGQLSDVDLARVSAALRIVLDL